MKASAEFSRKNYAETFSRSDQPYLPNIIYAAIPTLGLPVVLSFRTMTFETIATAQSGLSNIPAGAAIQFSAIGIVGPRGCEKIVSNREISMFVNVNAHPGSKPKALGELGELSRARVILERIQI